MLNQKINEKSFLRNKKKKRGEQPTLILTSLIDAFSILLIYLLSLNMTTEIEDKSIINRLPHAQSSEALRRGTTILIDKDRLAINGETVMAEEFSVRLQEVLESASRNERERLILQAPKEANMDTVLWVYDLARDSGMRSIEFAVIHGGASETL